MANKRQVFRQHHLARALKAAMTAGVPNPSVEVRLPTGSTLVVGSRGDAPAGKAARVPAKAGRTEQMRKGR